MTTLLSNWHFMRVLRAGFAVWIMAEAWRTGQWLLCYSFQVVFLPCRLFLILDVVALQAVHQIQHAQPAPRKRKRLLTKKLDDASCANFY